MKTFAQIQNGKVLNITLWPDTATPPQGMIDITNIAGVGMYSTTTDNVNFAPPTIIPKPHPNQACITALQALVTAGILTQEQMNTALGE